MTRTSRSHSSTTRRRPRRDRRPVTDGPRRTRPRDPSPVDAGDLPIDDVMDVQGDAPPIDQDAVIGIDEIEHERTPTRTELDAGCASPT